MHDLREALGAKLNIKQSTFPMTLRKKHTQAKW